MDKLEEQKQDLERQLKLLTKQMKVQTDVETLCVSTNDSFIGQGTLCLHQWYSDYFLDVRN